MMATAIFCEHDCVIFFQVDEFDIGKCHAISRSDVSIHQEYIFKTFGNSAFILYTIIITL